MRNRLNLPINNLLIRKRVKVDQSHPRQRSIGYYLIYQVYSIFLAILFLSEPILLRMFTAFIFRFCHYGLNYK